MSLLFTSLIVICTLIGMALYIQYLVKSNNLDINQNSLNYIAMITSDLSQNYDKDNNSINILQLALDNFVKDIKKEQRLLFFIDDTYSSINEKNLLYYFNPENIFYTIGNNSVNKELIQSLVSNNIYIPKGPSDIFWDIGYYKKHIPNSTIHIICFNSSLYTGFSYDLYNEKQQKQINQLKKDLDSLQEENTVYILTHNPIDFIFNKLDNKYKNCISGIFISNKNNNLTSMNAWDSYKGKSYMWNIPMSSYISVQFPLNTPLIMSETDVDNVWNKNLNIHR